jgi:predicted transcriptional regulator
MSDKQTVLEPLHRSPEEAARSEILDEIQTIEAIKKGQEDIAAGRYKSHDEVRALLASCATK